MVARFERQYSKASPARWSFQADNAAKLALREQPPLQDAVDNLPSTPETAATPTTGDVTPALNESSDGNDTPVRSDSPPDVPRRLLDSQSQASSGLSQRSGRRRPYSTRFPTPWTVASPGSGAATPDTRQREREFGTVDVHDVLGQTSNRLASNSRRQGFPDRNPPLHNSNADETRDRIHDHVNASSAPHTAGNREGPLQGHGNPPSHDPETGRYSERTGPPLGYQPPPHSGPDSEQQGRYSDTGPYSESGPYSPQSLHPGGMPYRPTELHSHFYSDARAPGDGLDWQMPPMGESVPPLQHYLAYEPSYAAVAPQYSTDKEPAHVKYSSHASKGAFAQPAVPQTYSARAPGTANATQPATYSNRPGSHNDGANAGSLGSHSSETAVPFQPMQPMAYPYYPPYTNKQANNPPTGPASVFHPSQYSNDYSIATNYSNNTTPLSVDVSPPAVRIINMPHMQLPPSTQTSEVQQAVPCENTPPLTVKPEEQKGEQQKPPIVQRGYSMRRGDDGARQGTHGSKRDKLNTVFKKWR